MTPGASSTAGPAVVRLSRVDSTQRVALDLAAAGAADRTVVVAEVQTAGRGRRGRVWEAAPGTSLLASILIRPTPSETLRLPTLSLTTAVAVADALERVGDVTTRLKWPNDVLVGARKVSGILLESRSGASPVVVVGIGINLLQMHFGGLARPATSVLLETGRRVARDAMLAAVLEAFDGWRGRVEREGFAPVRARWLTGADTLGRLVQVGETTGVAADIDDDGALVLETAEGRRHVVAGEVRDVHAARAREEGAHAADH
jgi:BirA family transcriptional regulator, biotin operon repressor / biotin---[acetyl-CoA-carboxylase] ligase